METEPDVDVDMKVGDVGEGGKRTGGMAVFKTKDGIVWKMTVEDLRLAADGISPPAQRRPQIVQVTKEDAPIQAQAPSTRRPSSELVDIEMDLPALSSQPVSAGTSKRTTPRPRQVSSEIKEDAPLQPQGPPLRASTRPAPPPIPIVIKETPIVRPVGPTRPMPRGKRRGPPKRPPSPVEGASSDIVPDSQDRAESEASPAVQLEETKPTLPSRKRKVDDRDALSNTQGEKSELENNIKPDVVGEADINEEVVPSSTAGDENILILDEEPVRTKKPVVDQSSEDDLTPPPMSPNLPPGRPVPVPRQTASTSQARGREREEQPVHAEQPEPSKRRKLQDAPIPATPVREKVVQGSADELSPVPSTPVHKPGPSNADESEPDNESESEPEVTIKPTRQRGRPRTRFPAEAPIKKPDEPEQETASRRTRRQPEANKRHNARNNKMDLSSPPSAIAMTNKRSSRPTPERQTRTRANRTRPSKDQEDGDEGENEVNGEDKVDEPLTIRRSGRHTRTMPDLREEDDEDDDETMESAAEEAASPAATIHSEKRSRRRKPKEKERLPVKKGGKDCKLADLCTKSVNTFSRPCLTYAMSSSTSRKSND
jgi:hypothetical protein